MPPNKPPRVSRALPALAVVLCSALARGDALTPEVREARSKEIAQKSESERARLQRNFKAFRELPQAEQDWLRQFSRELKADDRGEGKLRGVMNEYHDWLSTLTPGQRDDLRKEPDPVRRDKRVGDLLKKQQELADATGAKAGPKAPRGLSLDDLDAVMEIVEKAIHRFLTPEEMEQIKKKHGVARHAYIIDMAFPVRPRANSGPLGMPQWWSNDVLDAMVNAVSNPAQQHQLKNNRERGARVTLMGWLIAAIRSEYEIEHAKIKPDQETLERFFVKLNSEEQDEVMRVPFDQQQKKLLDLYLTKKAAEEPDNFPQPPQFKGISRIQQQAQRMAAARAADAAGAAESDAEKARKKKDKGKGKGNKSGND